MPRCVCRTLIPLYDRLVSVGASRVLRPAQFDPELPFGCTETGHLDWSAVAAGVSICPRHCATLDE